MKKNIIRKILFMLMVFGVPFMSVSLAQQADTPVSVVTGRVVDENDQPVPNLSVSSFYKQKKSYTKEDGTFSVEVDSKEDDKLTIEGSGYKYVIVNVALGGKLEDGPIVIKKNYTFDDSNIKEIPFSSFSANRSVSSITTISGEELASYPSASFVDALTGRVPGLIISSSNFTPGDEAFYAAARGNGATFYIDGIKRNPYDLSVFEIEQVNVIKDLSGRAMLGLSGQGPIVWIITKTGKSFKKELNVNVESGLSSPTILPKFLDAYNYASLYNEALANDGIAPLYSQTALDAYRNNSNSVRYPNINLYDKYVNNTTRFTRANVNFNGGDNGANYFTMIDYVGEGGYEAIGTQTTADRLKLRGNVNIRLNHFMKMNVNLSGTYATSRYPNAGSGSERLDLFGIAANYPANAHPISYGDYLITNDNFPINLTNELMYGGFAEGTDINTQNRASLMIDLNSVLTGLTFTGTVAFDQNNEVVNSKGGTAHLYRLLVNNDDEDIVERVVQQNIVPNMGRSHDVFLRRTTAFMNLDYDRTFGKHALTMNSSYYIGLEEMRFTSRNYQPEKVQDLGFRANYVYDGKYVLQFDLSHNGSMKLPAGKRYGTYPTIGAAWNISEEGFFGDNGLVNHLKLFTSYGVMGVNNFFFPGTYNPYYLDRTLWQNVGVWQSGIEGTKSQYYNVYNILQGESPNFTLPKMNYFNLGVQSELFARRLSVEVNYFHQRNYNNASLKQNFTPNLIGSGGFVPLVNFGEDIMYGVDGAIFYSGKAGDFRYSAGLNLQYLRSKLIEVDELAGLPDYRKRANKDADLFWIYAADGLFQTPEEITSRNIGQSWGSLQPGDIRYVDYNNDGVIDERDIHAPGAHRPRISYGLNLSLAYKNLSLFVLASGAANGEILMNGHPYFNNTSTTRNYSEPMLERWPETNNYPRLTTVSQNNYQSSTFWLVNGAYMNIKNIELKYSFPKAFATRVLMKDLDLFVRGRNLFTFSELTKYGLNPEMVNMGYGYPYPMARTYTLGVSCKF